MVAALADNNGPIFVVGSMRSGSTLLRLILDSHERIAIGPETGFMGAVAATKRIPQWRYGGDWYGRLGWDEAELDTRIREFYTGMFARYAAERGKARWGDKTPFHTALIPAMASIFPEAVFVGIVRHPGAVAVSLARKFHYSFTEAADYWTATNIDLVNGAAVLGERFALCRFEDLVNSPRPVTRSLVSWLGEEWSPNLVAFERVQRAQGAPRLADGDTTSRAGIDAARAASWADAVGPQEMEVLTTATGALASWFGYDVHDAHALRKLTDDPEPGICPGDVVARHRAAQADTVDFAPRRDVIAPDADLHDLAARTLQAEAALARLRSRRAVQVADALKRAARGRSPRELRNALRAARRPNLAN